MRYLAALVFLGGLMAPAAATQAAECRIQNFVDLPVTMVGTRPTVATKINGRDVTFIADSGAFFSTLGTTVAKELRLNLQVPPNYLRIQGVGGDGEFSMTRVNTFTFAGVPLPNVDFFVTAGAGGVGYSGLIGQNIWSLGDVEYDLGGGAIRLFKPYDCGDRDMAYWAGDKPYSTLGMERADPNNRMAVVVATVNGQRIRAMLDTGASSSVMKMSAASRAGLRPDTPGVTPAGLAGGIGSRSIRSWTGPVASFKIGAEEIKNTRMRFGEIELEDVDMLLGADFFLAHRVYVANSQRRVFFTYSGGPVFNLTVQNAAPASPAASPPTQLTTATKDPAAREPKTAEDFSRRGAALDARRNYEGAAGDFAKAIELAPENPAYYLQRARTRLELKQPMLARADVDQALKLKPDDIDALILRAELRLADRERPEAIIDLDHAANLASKPADVRLVIARLYAQMDLFDRALPQFDLWIDAHEDSSEMAGALGGRCRVRALANRELDRALSDCNQALRGGPPTPAMYDARAIVYLRKGEFDRAIEDYNRVLTVTPRSAWSLYGRGVARLGKGSKAEGEADIAAALAINPSIADTARARGIEPPAAIH